DALDRTQGEGPKTRARFWIERRQSFHCYLDYLTSLGLHSTESSAFTDQLDDACNVRLGHWAGQEAANCLTPHGIVCSVDEGQRRDSLSHILTQRLAGLVAEVENVVDHLEGGPN